ncbi:Reticulon [Macleaya cordata]|uniref:Reticulon-like protein n=1 Tax=Macleaya cordata TaxID=56857 RepID=A0A200Q0B4_MACCD|nr:Reticulon [Macleaya cordata]
MEVSRRRIAARNVVAGSVWESRMKMDEVKGGIKVFNGEENSEEGNKTFEQNQSGVVREKRKTWKCEPVIDPILIRKIRSDELSSEDFQDSVDGFEKNPIQTRSTRSDEPCKEPFNPSIDLIEKSPIQRRKSRSRSHKISDETSKEFDGDEKDKVVVKEEIEVSKKNVDVKEVKLSEERSKKVLILKEKINQSPKTPIPISANVKKQQTLVVNHSVIHPTLTKPSPVKVSEKIERLREPQNKFQNLVDIVMWRDILKSSFVFGIGTLILLSPSVTEDLNFSLISAISYLALLCIAAIFLYKAILCRGPVDLDDSHTVGEEEAIYLVKVVLPWLNKFILELRYLLSGDPATTMKFAGSLFLLARCGSFITVWRMVILGFFGVFTVPKVYSWYSRQLMQEGKLWLSRCRNAWNSYTYMKVIAVAIFTLIWSSSANVARIWEVFMLIVAVRYYQDMLIMEECCEAAADQKEDSREGMMKEEMRTETESEWRAFFS